MSPTVDLVVAGDVAATVGVAAEALRRGLRVLVVMPGTSRAARRLRTSLSEVQGCAHGQLTVIPNAEVVCVDGVDGVEAVVIRSLRTGRLWAVNAAAFLRCDTETGKSEVRTQK